MSTVPTIFVSKAVHYPDSTLSLDTVRYSYDPRPDGSAAISRAYASDAHEFLCFNCVDDMGIKYTKEGVISEEWENVAVIVGNLGVSWKCDSCDKHIHEMNDNTDAYLYIHAMN